MPTQTSQRKTCFTNGGFGNPRAGLKVGDKKMFFGSSQSSLNVPGEDLPGAKIRIAIRKSPESFARVTTILGE
jgi:hypothetical protein